MPLPPRRFPAVTTALAALAAGAARPAVADPYPVTLPTGTTILAPAPAGSDGQFGAAIAVDGQFAIVTAPNGPPPPAAGPEGVFGSTVWYLLLPDGVPIYALLDPEQMSTSQGFGDALAMNEEFIVVGKPFDDAVSLNAGAAFVFERSTGQLVRRLDDPDATSSVQFGTSLAISGDTLLVGVPRAFNFELGARTGEVWLFDLRTGERTGTLRPESGGTNDRFGDRLAVDGDLVAVGAPSAGNAGRAFTFDLPARTQIAALAPPDFNRAVLFGWSVALSGRDLVVSDQLYEPEGTFSAGAAWVVDAITGQFLRELDPGPLAFGDGFGTSVAVQGDLVAVSAPGDDAAGLDDGLIRTFELSTGLPLGTIRPPADAPPAQQRLGQALAAGPLGVLAGVGAVSGSDGAVLRFDLGTPCPLDLSGDRVIGFHDIVEVLERWAQAGGPADLDADGTVGMGDLMLILSCWGDCRGD